MVAGRRRRRAATAPLSAAALLSVAALLATGCSVKPTARPTPSITRATLAARTEVPSAPLRQLRWALPADVTTLDPLAAADPLTRSVLANTCESLLRVQPDGTVVEGLATLARPAPTSYVFTLRAGAAFADGSAVTAQDVVASLTRHVALRVPHPDALDAISSIEATAPGEVTLTLAHPDVRVPEVLAGPAGVVVRRGAAPVRPDLAPSCSGPYVVASWERGRRLVLRRNPRYWDASTSEPPGQVVFQVVPRSLDAAREITAGRLDGMYDPDNAALRFVAGAAAARVAYGRSTTTATIRVTNFQGPLSDLRLRAALSLAVDRVALARLAPVGGAVPAKAPASAGSWAGASDDGSKWLVNLPPVRRSVEDARRLVVEAGVPDRPIVIATGPDPLTRALGEVIRSSTVTSGLPIKILPVAPAELMVLMRDPAERPDIDAYVSVGTSDTADPLQVYGSICGSRLPRTAGFDGGSYGEVCGRALVEPDRGRRLPLVDQLQKLAVGSDIWIPLYEQPSIVVQRRGVTGAPAGFSRAGSPWVALIGAGP